MLNRSSILAFTAVTVLAASALAPTSASARGFSFGGGGGMGHPTTLGRGGGFPSTGLHNGSMNGFKGSTLRRIPGISVNKPIKPFPGVLVNRPPKLPPPWLLGCAHHPFSPYCHGHGHGWGFPPVYVEGPPAVVGGGVVGGAAVATTGVAAQPAAPCTCLTKSYLQDGSVLFQDVCTKEAAVSGTGTGPTAAQ